MTPPPNPPSSAARSPAPVGPPVDALGQVLPCPPYAVVAGWRRFARQTVLVPGGCLLWLGRPRDDGYGQFWAGPGTLSGVEAAGLADRPKPWKAHRWAFMAHYGPLGADLEVRHRCDEPLCVLAAHLEPGSSADNAADRDSRGRLAHPGRYGLMWWGSADRRAAYGRSLALHQALTHAIDVGAEPGDLPAVVAAVAAGGTSGDVPLPLGELDLDADDHDTVQDTVQLPASGSNTSADLAEPSPQTRQVELVDEPLQLALFDEPDHHEPADPPPGGRGRQGRR